MKKTGLSNADKFHKSAVLLAEKLVGVDSGKFATFPFVAKVNGGYALFVPGSSLENADYDYLHPYIMNAGFSLELKLKQLLEIEGSSAVRGHNIFLLYKSLKDESREFISKHVASIVKDSVDHQVISEKAKSGINFDINWDVEFLLEKSAHAFDRWRYLHEKDNVGSWFVGYIEIFNALDSRINSF